MTEFVTTSTGVRLAYERAGEGDPPIVFIHGWCCDRSHFAPEFEHFAARRAALSLDLRGHGESDRPEPEAQIYRIEALADDALGVATAAGFECPIVVGHSLGGLVALACAARPDRVCAAVLINPALSLDPRAKAFFARSRAAISNDVDGTWRAAFAARIMLPTDTARRGEILTSVGRMPRGIAAAVWHAMERYDGAAALARVRVPLLAILSGDVEVDLRAHCPAATVGRTVGAGHFNQLEVPEQVNAMIERFLAVNRL
jgi:pimeloyl-ACP methyl ester carboxylesterase